jgi:hypothetical protein
MDICRHCGKTVRVDASLGRGVDADPQMTAARTIWVDEALLRLCNAALEHATRAGTAEVEVSHLLLAALEARDHRLAIEAAGLDMEVLARTARRQVILADRRLGEASPRTSDMLRTILCRTTEAARAEGRECATFEHLLETLVLSCDDIGPIAELVSEAARQPSRPTGEARATELASGAGAVAALVGIGGWRYLRLI